MRGSAYLKYWSQIFTGKYDFFPLINNDYLIYSFAAITLIFFILSLSSKFNEIIKFLVIPYKLIKKIYFIIIKKSKEETITDKIEPASEPESIPKSNNKNEQPILPFSETKETKNISESFKLPSINFLKVNSELKNKKNLDRAELNKNSEFLEKPFR